MHMVRGLSTLRTRRPQFKMTKAKRAELEADWQQHNRDLRRQGQPRISFDEYVDNRCGRVRDRGRSVVVKLPTDSAPYRRDTPQYPSLTTMGTPDSCARRESIKYTGTLVKGIATMHKSNAVPVIDEEQMKDISRMRRG